MKTILYKQSGNPSRDVCDGFGRCECFPDIKIVVVILPPPHNLLGINIYKEIEYSDNHEDHCS